MSRSDDDVNDPGRREVVLLVGSLAAAGVFGCGSGGSAPSAATAPSSSPSEATGGSCVIRPRLTEGPYHVDESLDRSDLRTDPSDGTTRPGVDLHLSFVVSRAGDCAPLAGALVDVWHCDALGVYSDVRDAGFDTVGQRFLRGYQLTDGSGLARFVTIYPGWYAGRAVHVHFKVRSAPGAASGLEFTSQLFFDEAVTDLVHAQAPYSSKGRRSTTNAADGIYQAGGSRLLLTPVAEGTGYAATIDLSVDGLARVATPAPGSRPTRRACRGDATRSATRPSGPAGRPDAPARGGRPGRRGPPERWRGHA